MQFLDLVSPPFFFFNPFICVQHVFACDARTVQSNREEYDRNAAENDRERMPHFATTADTHHRIVEISCLNKYRAFFTMFFAAEIFGKNAKIGPNLS